MRYYRTDQPYPRGELWVKTGSTIQGYYNNSVDTNRSFVDGWFCTGDIVEQINASQIKIIDRKKNFFKMSQGEFVAAERLENVYLACPFVRQIFITCADLIKYSQQQNAVMAVIVPNEALVLDWAMKIGEKSKNFEDLCQNPLVNQMILTELKLVAEKKNLRPFEIPWATYIEPESFSIENRKMTATNKLARPVVDKFYRSIIDSIMANKHRTEQTFVENGGDSLAAIKLAVLSRVRGGESIETGLSSSNSSWKEDIKLDPSIVANEPEVDGIFLTGCTGFLGAYLLGELLTQTSKCKIYCLVRSFKSEKITQILTYYDLWKSSFDKNRIVTVIGNLTHPQLGLSDDEWTQLSSKIDVIYHCGAMVNHIKDYETHRATNVQGTIEIIKLACSKRIRLNYISTLSVLSAENNNLLYEFQLQKTGGYTQSKWVAEALVTQAKDRGLPITIFRPGMISWCSTSGKCNEQDWLYRLFTGLIHHGSAPDVDSMMDLSPVDYVSKVIIELGQQKTSINEIYNIHNSNKMISFKTIWNGICDVMREAPQYVEFDEWWEGVLAKIEQDRTNNKFLNGLLLFQNGISEDGKSRISSKSTMVPFKECTNTFLDLNVTVFANELLENLSSTDL
ncbi:unnamed protein product [Didymodactylos carnosus]|uniref:Thioester reductase (TE) domain-containing protein n=2 Tax=Didymodactylos carnosus TaxID=1234261 RepID=A0A814WFI9_9BILA|nr:unnamed protein product [Didymodactylos carnosus]CAF3967696.1 unnamed protein product [Didymodactylos carnosus]